MRRSVFGEDEYRILLRRLNLALKDLHIPKSERDDLERIVADGFNKDMKEPVVIETEGHSVNIGLEEMDYKTAITQYISEKQRERIRNMYEEDPVLYVNIETDLGKGQIITDLSRYARICSI